MDRGSGTLAAVRAFGAGDAVHPMRVAATTVAQEEAKRTKFGVTPGQYFKPAERLR
jgi:hypothetical protein